MRLALLLAMSVAFTVPAFAGGFYDFLTLLNMTPSQERQALVDSFIADLPGGEAPVKEDTMAFFVFNGPASSMAVAGDMTSWSPTLAMIKVSGTTFWYREFGCPSDARLDYKFVRNGTEWMLDPLNPHTCAGGYGPNSELAMPDYVQPPEIADYGYPPCGIDTYEGFFSPQLGNSRTIRVITPPGYSSTATYPTFIVHDGLEYISLASLDRVLAFLAVHYPGAALPICVCIPPVNRTEEYAGSQQQAFGRFITETVIPFVNERYATAPGDPAMWGSMGASNGGNVSLYLAGTYPQQFRRLVIMSPYVPHAQADLIAAQPPETYRIYMNWGSYDIQELIPLIEAFDGMMGQLGIPHLSRLFHEGHSWGLWRATIDEGLLFCEGVQGDDDMPVRRPETGDARIEVFPNPFGPHLGLRVLGTLRAATISVYDLAGHQMHRAVLPAGVSHWRWQPSGLAPGPCVIEVDDGAARVFTRAVRLAR